MRKILVLFLSIFLILSGLGCRSSPDAPPSSYHQQAIAKYMTFEELIATSTDVIKGRCIEFEEYADHFEYTFEVLERYAGEATGDPIRVYVPFRSITIAENNIAYRTTDVAYQINKSYYLILERNIDVYAEYDRYINVGGNIYLPANELDHCSIYGQKLTAHSKNTDYTNEEALLKHIKEILSQRSKADTRLYSGVKYINSSDMAEILQQSDFVLKVKISADKTGRGVEDRSTFECTVLSTLKGDVKESSTVSIVFPKNAAAIGETHIVALYELPNNTPRHFVFSSKSSLFDISQEAAITSLISG